MRVFNQETKKKPEYCVLIIESYDEAKILQVAVEAHLAAHPKSKKIWAVNEALGLLAVY